MQLNAPNSLGWGCLCLILCLPLLTFSQGVGINATGASPHNSALLDITSTSAGVLVPRMTAAQRNLITSPATGLLIFQTNSTPGFYYYTGSAWKAVGGADTDWTITGSEVYQNTLPVGIGTASPSASYDLTVGTTGAQINGVVDASDYVNALGLTSTKAVNPLQRDTMNKFELTGAALGVGTYISNSNSGPGLEVYANYLISGDTAGKFEGTHGVVATGRTFGVVGQLGASASGTAAGDFLVPGTASGAGIRVRNLNAGKAATFDINSVFNSDTMIYATSAGSGAGLVVNLSAGTNSSDALDVTHGGTGRAANLKGDVRLSPHSSAQPFTFVNSGGTNEPSIIPGANNYGVLGTAGTRLYDMHITNISYYGTLTNASDRRIKKNIRPLESGLAKVLALRPCRYDLRPEVLAGANATEAKLAQARGEGMNKIGFIAQELQTVLPELVHYNAEADLHSVNYIGVIPVLVEAIQDQQAQIELLEKRLEALENK